MARKEEIQLAAEDVFCLSSIREEAFVIGAEWADKTMIDKACEFFAPYIQDNSGGYDRAFILDMFRKAMEE